MEDLEVICLGGRWVLQTLNLDSDVGASIYIALTLQDAMARKPLCSVKPMMNWFSRFVMQCSCRHIVNELAGDSTPFQHSHNSQSILFAQ